MNRGELEVLMVRHAHAEWVPDETRPLSPRGLEDAEEIARLLTPLAPETIYSSPYRRAVQTVEPLAGRLGLEIHVVEGLRERTLADGAVDDFEAAMKASWDDHSLAFEGGETSTEARLRFGSAFDDLVERHPIGRIAVGTHGNILGLFLQSLDPSYGYEFWRSMTWPDVYRLFYADGEVQAVERLWPDPESQDPERP